MSESYHTSRMRETCTSGSQEGRGETVIGTAFQSVLPAYSTVEILPALRDGRKGGIKNVN